MSDVINYYNEQEDADYLDDMALYRFSKLSDIRNTNLIVSQKAVNDSTGNIASSPGSNYSTSNNFATGKAKQLLDIALGYSGIPYVFGSDPNTTTSFDCSSFTKHCFAQIGIDLPRTAEEQSQKGIDPGGNLQPGDLVFWQGTYKAGVSHVGIYMYGDKFIAASSSKGVSTGSLNSPYYKSHYWGARRVL